MRPIGLNSVFPQAVPKRLHFGAIKEVTQVTLRGNGTLSNNTPYIFQVLNYHPNAEQHPIIVKFSITPSCFSNSRRPQNAQVTVQYHPDGTLKKASILGEGERDQAVVLLDTEHPDFVSSDPLDWLTTFNKFIRPETETIWQQLKRATSQAS